MGKARKTKKSDPLAVVLARVRSAAEAVDDNGASNTLFADVQWLVEQGQEKRLYQLLESGELDDEAWEAIELALQNAGYRLHLPPAEPTGAPDPAHFKTAIPFALQVSVPVLESDLAKFPHQLPQTIKQMVEQNFLRRAFHLPDDVSIFLDHRLYRTDQAEWQQESAVRRYLKAVAAQPDQSASNILPLASDYRKAPKPPRLAEGLDQAAILQRIICGVAITEDGPEGDTVDEVEMQLFGELEEAQLEELGRWIQAELQERGLHAEAQVLVTPHLVELWEVPEAGLELQRMTQLMLQVESGLQRLLAMAPAGKPLAPILYLSRHGTEEWIVELRLAAFASSTAEDPFFTYAWEIDHDLEDPEIVAEIVNEVAQHLGASITLVDELLQDERCGDCGEKLFYGPGGDFHHPAPIEF